MIWAGKIDGTILADVTPANLLICQFSQECASHSSPPPPPPPPPPQFLHQHSPVHSYRLQSGNRISTTASLARSLSSVHASLSWGKLQEYCLDNTSPAWHFAHCINYKGDWDRCKSTTMWNRRRRRRKQCHSKSLENTGIFSRIVFFSFLSSFADLVDFKITVIIIVLVINCCSRIRKSRSVLKSALDATAAPDLVQ